VSTPEAHRKLHPWFLAFQIDLGIHLGGQLLHQRETDPGARRRARQLVLTPIEQSEEFFTLAAIDPRTVVANEKGDLALLTTASFGEAGANDDDLCSAVRENFRALSTIRVKGGAMRNPPAERQGQRLDSERVAEEYTRYDRVFGALC
jgi:hypothetical protein